MELLERDDHLATLEWHYQQVKQGLGHTIFLGGEAGIGKSSLVNHFVKMKSGEACAYVGSCDSLFTPRPLGPLYDVASQVSPDFIEFLRDEKDRTLVFTALLQKITASQKPILLIFEDVHWADEATFDLIKFLSRRIHRQKCLFLITYRDGEIYSGHPLANTFGELQAECFTKILLPGFSKETVRALVAKKGLTTGDEVYQLTGGNPFYVMEILANEFDQIPERVKDSILTVFHSKSEATKGLWEFLSILPSSHIELSIAKRIESDFANCIDYCITAGLIVSKPGHLSFKHELFRIAIEESLSPTKRVSLHKKMLQIIQEVSDGKNLSQLVHHARYAGEKELVAKVAPQAAQEAAAVGSHIEASKLYLTAIEFTDKEDTNLVEWYERYAYECYLINQMPAAIMAQQQALDIWRKRKVSLKEGDTLRFLSRLWWFEGDQTRAIDLALQAIKVLENGFPTRERAMAYSNLSQLHMLSDDREDALYWGNKAIDLGVRMCDHEIETHALNNVGSVLLTIPTSRDQGEDKLNRSLAIALEHGLHEHAARAYASLSFFFLWLRSYDKSEKMIEEGIRYCEERDLNSWKYYIIGCKARLLLERGDWKKAEEISRGLQHNTNSLIKVNALVVLAKLAMRQGNFTEAKLLIGDAKEIAMATNEIQRIVPVLTAELELNWMEGERMPKESIDWANTVLFKEKNHSTHFAEFSYWLKKCNSVKVDTSLKFMEPFKLEFEGNWMAAATSWKNLGCPFEQALALADGDVMHQKQALLVLHDLGAKGTYEIVKSKLKLMGVKNIPRGPRESTRSNPAQLTNRQIDVLVLLNEGLQNTEIAEKLFISAKTVDHHISAILSKLEVNSRSKAVREASRLGILS